MRKLPSESKMKELQLWNFSHPAVRTIHRQQCDDHAENLPRNNLAFLKGN
jgi:hypothetical protein